jgi:hypothetical protein
MQPLFPWFTGTPRLLVQVQAQGLILATQVAVTPTRGIPTTKSMH